MLNVATGPTRSVSGVMMKASPGNVVVHARLKPEGAQIASVTSGFEPWRSACGHQANDQMSTSGSRMWPTKLLAGCDATTRPK